MQIAVELPDDIAADLATSWVDLPRALLECLALEGHRAGLITVEQTRRTLKLENRAQAENFLKQRGAFLEYVLADLADECRLTRRLFVGQQRIPVEKPKSS